MIEDYNYPLLGRVTDYFQNTSTKSLENVHIFACQHILEPQEKMFILLSKFGIRPQNIHILGKIYSTNFEVLDELKKIGFETEQPAFDFTRSFDEQHKESCNKIFESLVKTNKRDDRVIVLDDGADLLNIFNNNLGRLNSQNIIGIEQTSSGFRKLEKEKLNFPIINVARSVIKLDKESPLIARLGCDRINDVIKKYNISEPRILVIGLGPMGNNVLLILKEDGHSVVGHDTIFDKETNILDLILQNKINVLVGATGNSILSEGQALKLEAGIKNEIYFISMSSADREFPASFLRKSGKLDKSIHGDSAWNKIVLVNNGFPITFKGNRYESTPLEIEKTIALLYGSVLYATDANLTTDELMEVPEQITNIIQNDK